MEIIVKDKTCCFFGHRKIDKTEELKANLYGIIENLIVNENIDTFLFGSKSQFDSLCHKIVTELKENYLPPKRRNSKRDLTDCQPKSGTKIAYEYAQKKRSKIINLFNPVK